MIGVGVRRVVLARGELDKLDGPQYAARRAELRREAGEAARARDRQAAVALQNEAEESGATEEPGLWSSRNLPLEATIRDPIARLPPDFF